MKFRPPDSSPASGPCPSQMTLGAVFPWPVMMLAAGSVPAPAFTPTEAVLIGAGLAGGVALVVLLILNRSIRTLERGARRLAEGDLSQRVAVNGPLMISSMAESLNEMAKQLQHRLSTVVEQRNELGAVLSSMNEGVIAVDQEQRILSLNPSAARMFHIDARESIGRPIEEVIRNTSLQNFVRQTLSHHTATQAEFPLRLETSISVSEHIIEAQGAALRDMHDRRIGAVMVFHDVTRLRKLESIRTDFVSNVSHEIKTPVTAIKGAIETLLDEPDPAFTPDTLKFLQIISRQSDRLVAIIEDLLSLTRLEHDNELLAAERTACDVQAIIHAAVETCQATAQERQSRINVECSSSITALGIAPLLEQALVNLIVNAIKYSPDRSSVLVSAMDNGHEVVISVQDHGRGIEPEHLPRVFERFYRTDKARSRQMGGTGLGLSIVKHIAEVHRGRVSVNSTPGAGSTFRIHLEPVKPAGRRTISAP